MRKHEKDQQVIDLKLTMDDADYDPIAEEWIGVDNNKIVRVHQGRDGNIVKEVTVLLKCKENMENGDFLSKQKHAREKLYARFVQKDGCMVDIAGLTVKAVKLEPIMTKIFLGHQSLEFDMHDNNISSKVKFLVKTDSEETTKSQTTVEQKTDCPCKYTFKWDARRYTLTISVNGATRTTMTAGTPGYFGIIPTVANSIFTLNPFRPYYPKATQSSSLTLLAVETSAEIAAKEKPAEELATLLGSNGGFELMSISEDNKYILGFSNGFAAAQVDTAKDTNIYHLVSSLADFMAADGVTASLKAFVAVNGRLVERALTEESESGQSAVTAVSHMPEVVQDDESKKVLYIKATDSLLLYGESSIKLLKRKHGKFAVHSNLFDDTVLSRGQSTTLEISTQEATVLVHIMKNEIIKFRADGPEKIDIMNFLVDLSNRLPEASKSIVVCEKFNTLSQIVTSLLYSAVNSLKYVATSKPSGKQAVDIEAEADPQDGHIAMNNLFDNEDFGELAPGEQKEEKKKGTLGTYTYFAIKILLEILEKLRAKSVFLESGTSLVTTNTLSTTTRLASYARSKYCGSDFLELARNGLYNDFNSYCNNQHFLAEDKPISGLDSPETTQQSIFEILATNGLDSQNIASILNVPLSSFVNHMPAVNFCSNISRVDSDTSGKILVTLESGEIYLYDTVFCLVKNYYGNLREEVKTRVLPNKLIEKKGKVLINLDQNINEKVFDALVEQKAGVEEDNPDKIEPDASKLEYLYQMGFSVELARKALIKTKNQSIDMAIEMLFNMQSSEKTEDRENLQEAVSLIKPVWTCDQCTFNNDISDIDYGKDMCQMCGSPAPIFAYYTKEEIDQMRDDQAKMLQAEMDKQAILLSEQNKSEEAIEQLNTIQGELIDIKVGSLSTNFLTRMFVASAFNHSAEEGSTLRIRRLGYSAEYLKTLIQETTDGTSSVNYIRLGNEALIEGDGVNLEKSLSDCLKDGATDQLDSFMPFFCYSGDVMETVQQVDVKVDGQIIALSIENSSNISRREIAEDDKKKSAEWEVKRVVVLIRAKEGQVKLQTFDISCKVYDFFDATTEVKAASEVQIDGLGDSTREPVLFKLPNETGLLHDGKITTYSTELNLQRTINLGSVDYSKVKVNGANIMLFAANGNTFWVSTQSNTQEESLGTPTAPTNTKSVLTCEDILNFMHQKKHIKFEIDTYGKGTAINYDSPEDRFTYKSTVVAQLTSSKIRVSLKTLDKEVKNGIFNMSFGFSRQNIDDRIHGEAAITATGATATINVLDESEESRYIPLNVAFQSFGDMNANNLLGSSLFHSGLYYSAKRADVNYAFFENQFQLDMSIKQVTLTSKARDGFSQIKTALVFSTNSTGIINKFDLSCLQNKEKFQLWHQKKLVSADRFEEYEPVGFLELSDSKSTESLIFVRKSRYVCLVFGLDAKKNAFNINFIGMKGSTHAISESRSADFIRPSKPTVDTGYQLSILNHDTVIGQNLNLQVDAGSRQDCVSIYNINFYERLKEVFIEIDRPTSSEYKLEYFSIEAIKCGSNSDKGLKEIFENRDKLLELIRAQAQRLRDDSVKLEEKKRIINMFSDMIVNFDSKLAQDIHEIIDVEYLIKNMIMKAIDNSLLSDISALFDKFSQIDAFTDRLKQTIASVIDNIGQLDTNRESLKNFFKLVDTAMTNPKYEGLGQNLQALISRAILKLQEVTSKENKLLRSLGIYASFFDDSSFWNLSTSKKTDTKADELADYLSSECLIVKSLSQIDIYCDMKAEVSLDRLLVKFINMSKPNPDVPTFISVHKVDLHKGSWEHSSQTLILNKEVSPSFINYSNKTAREASLAFSNKDQYNALGFRMEGISGRYFKVSLAFDNSKHTKAFFKLNKQQIEAYFFGSVSEDAATIAETKAVLPNIPLNMTAKMTQGELLVVSKSIKGSGKDSGSSQKIADGSIEAVQSDVKSTPVTEEISEKSVESANNIESAKSLLRDCLMSVKGNTVSAEESIYIKDIADNLLKLREDSNDWTKNTKGEESFNFWITVIDLTGSSNEIQKVNFSLTFEHFKGILEHIFMAGLDQKVQDICLRLMKNCIGKEKTSSAMKTLKKLISHISTKDNINQTISMNLVSVIHTLLDNVKDLPTYDLVTFMLTKLCKKFNDDRSHCLLQMLLSFELLFMFNRPVIVVEDDQTIIENKVADVLYSTLSIILWTYEQDMISDADKQVLSEKAIKLFNQVLKHHKAILPASFKIEKGIFEMMLIRSFKLNMFKNLESILESIFSLTASKEGEAIGRDMLTIYSDVLTQLVSYMKEGQAAGNTIALTLKSDTVPEDIKLEFLSFMIKNCDQLAKQLTHYPSKPEEIKEGESQKPTIKKRKTMTPDEISAHRSLSATSQTQEKQEQGIVSSSTLKDLIGLYTKMYQNGMVNLNLFSEISKLIFNKGATKEYLKQFFELYNGHKYSQKTLITNDIINVVSDSVESLKKAKQPEEENPALKEFLSCLTESVIEMISPIGLENLDEEFVKLVMSCQEMVIGAELKKGPAAVIKTLAGSLTISCVSTVFFFSAHELNRLCNWGGPDGYDSLEKSKITYLEIIMNYMSIVTLATSSAKSLILNDLVSNLKSVNMSKVSDAVYQLLEWNVFNNMNSTKKSPAMDRLSKIISFVDQIFKALADNPEAGKILIKRVFDIVNDVHGYLMPKINSDEINFVAISIVYNLFGCLEKILDITLRDNHMINYFVLESKGIHYIFDLLNLSYELKKLAPEIEQQKVESILAFINTSIKEETLNDVAQEHPITTTDTATQPALLAVPTTTAKVSLVSSPSPQPALSTQLFGASSYLSPGTALPKPVAKPTATPVQPTTTPGPTTVTATQICPTSLQALKTNIPSINPDKFSEEYAKDLKCISKINGKDEKITDWQKNKKAGGKHLFIYQMNNENAKNCREMILDFKMSHPTDLRTIKAGFLTQYNDFGNKIVAEPSYIQIHYKSKESDQWQYLCPLDVFEDNGYYMSANACYQKNFLRMEGTNFKERIESLCVPKKISYLRFLVGRPIVSFQENYSNLKAKDYNQLNLAPSFLSILGVNSNFYNLQVQNNYLKETTLLKLIHKVFSKDQKIFEALSNQNDLIDRFKIIFDRLVDDYVDLFTTPLISFSKNNTSFGVWVLSKLLDLKNKEEHAKVVGEIIMSSPDQYQSRLSMLCDFIMTEIAKDLDSKMPHSDRLYNFMTVFSSCIHRIPGETELTAVQTLNIDKEQIDLLVQFFKKIPYIQQFKNFFITLMYLPNKAFQLKFETPMDYLMHSLSDAIRTNNDYVVAELLSLIAIAKKRYADVILDENIADFLFKNIKKMDGQCMISVLLFFRNIINHEACKKRVIELQLPELIFDHLKQMISKEQNSPPKMQIIMILGLDIIKYVTTTDADSAKKFAELLYKHCQDIAKSTEDSSYLMESIFLPILLSIQTQKVFFEKKIQKKAITDFDENKAKEESEPDFKLKSEYIPSELLPTLHSNTDLLLDSSTKDKFRNGKWEMIASTQTNCSYDLTTAIEDQLLGQGAFMILIDGEASNLEYTLGIFCSTGLPKDPKVSAGNRDISVANSDNHFVFLYEKKGKQNTCHYRTKSTTDSETFLRYNDKNDANDKGIQIYYMNLEKIFLSFTDPNNNHIDLYPMKCLETDPQPNFEFPFDFHMKRGLEIWKLTMPESDGNSKDGKLSNMFSMGPLNLNNEILNISYSYYRNSTVYNIPTSITLDNLKKSMFNDPPEAFQYVSNKAIAVSSKTVAQLKEEMVPADDLDILDLEYNKDQDAKDIILNDLKDQYSPNLPILEHFISINGMEFILDKCIDTIKNDKAWVDKPYAATWEQITREIQTFAKIDFIPIFARSLTSIQTLLKIVSKAQANDKTWSSNEEAMISSVCSAVAKLFQDNKSTELRNKAIKEGILRMILDKLQAISKEVSRKWIEKEEVEEKKVEAKKEVKEEGKTIKRKGVGYEGVTNTNWSTDEFFKLAEAKNKKIKSLLEIVQSILEVEGWEAPEETLSIICESCLLPLIENAFRNTTLLDMAKEKELYSIYLKLCSSIAGIEKLVSSLMPLDNHYTPKQTISIEKLLGQLSNSSNTFKQLTPVDSKSNKGTDETTKSAFLLADEIIKTNDKLVSAISTTDAFKDRLSSNMEAILALPMEQKYKALLENHRFGYADMKNPKDTTKYVHHWKSEFAGKYAPQPAKMIRLAQEIADISNNLPIDSTNAMFVRADEERLDVMKAVIFGAEGCPYAHGAFEYDIYFGNDYPNVAPKVNLQTTGNSDVRFNPNLYNCGKVCLSLLGTWRGNASESWDPKLSTLTQVLISIQAVVMSEEVYFNEPGYGHEAGTEAGEMKNIGYSNIVRLCNVKYGMIGQIENPTVGFENVIRTHFVLKKDKILKSVAEWKALAQEKEATYTGLVADHNPNYCDRFKSKSTNYFDDLCVAIEKLEKTLASLEMPPIDALLGSKTGSLKMNKDKKKQVAITEGQANIEEIDMTYDENIQLKSMQNDEAGVKDRWSRYIGVMGMESVTKQANASIFISGLNSLGIEIAKNIVLSGAKRITLHDSKLTNYSDLAGQFFLGESDIGKNRAAASLNKIQQLNFYVKVDLGLNGQAIPTAADELEKIGIKDYEVIVLVDATHEVIEAVSKLCRLHNRCLIVADCHGVFSRVFCDFGTKFMCLDKNGEEAPEVMIDQITCEENGKVTLLEGVKHTFEDGDTIVMRNVEGMRLLDEHKKQISEGEEPPESIEGIMFKVKTINYNSFFIGDTRMFGKHIRGGLAKQVKLPFEIKFEPYHEIYCTEKPIFESNLEFHDFMKVPHPRIIHLCYLALNDFRLAYKSSPAAYNLDDAVKFYELFMKRAESFKDFVDVKETKEVIEKVVFRFAMTLEGNFGPHSAYIGGIVSQEIVKFITGKFSPIRQTFYADSIEVLPEEMFPKDIATMKAEDFLKLVEEHQVTAKQDRDDGIRTILGAKMLDRVKYSQLFMVGSGAIGCELLKNYAMIGLGTGKKVEGSDREGKIILTDPDVIEVSNLNRQFLFREKHLRKPKSVTAAAAAQMMNPQLQGHLLARLDKVHEGTSNIFTDQFFEKMTIVTNALDNIQARKYIDIRCVTARTPLIESGTLGPKGHVQVIIPNQTESYGSMSDPVEELTIPHCTLKMFPEETLHCVEWARDLFGSLFTQSPQALRKCLEESKEGTLDNQDPKAIKDSLKLAKKAPTTFDDCIKFARERFEKYYNYDIKQLLYVYPLDFKDKEGNPFWKLPKRPPHPVVFDTENKLYVDFIVALSALRAKIFNLPLDPNIRDEANRKEIAQKAAKIVMPEFKPNDEKAKEISKDVEKQNTKPGTEDMEEGGEKEKPVEQPKEETFEEIKKNFTTSAAKLKIENILPEEFEKDDDMNFHIDAIYSLANMRASNYLLDHMDWITVKIKAGKIVPALATTTASIAGLQTLEVVKVLKQVAKEHIKNAFLNLAVPILTQSEPADAPKIELTEGLTVTLWDRWQFTDCSEKTFQDIFKEIQEKYKLYPRDIIQGAKSIYMKALGDSSALKLKLGELFGAAKGDHEDITIACSTDEDGKKPADGVPIIRLAF